MPESENQESTCEYRQRSTQHPQCRVYKLVHSAAHTLKSQVLDQGTIVTPKPLLMLLL